MDTEGMNALTVQNPQMRQHTTLFKHTYYMTNTWGKQIHVYLSGEQIGNYGSPGQIHCISSCLVTQWPNFIYILAYNVNNTIY